MKTLHKFIFAALVIIFVSYTGHGFAEEDRTMASDAPATWNDYLEKLKQINQLQDYIDLPLSDTEVAQFLFKNLSHAYIVAYQSDPDFPEFVPFVNHVHGLGGPNPDNTHYFATIDGRNTYRITGQRGTVHMIDIQVGTDWVGFSEKPGKALVTKQMSEFMINEDGTFEILLSKFKPGNYQGNWMPLDDEANYIIVRQVGYGPDEVDARMAISRVGGEARRLAVTDVEKRRRLDLMISYASNSYRLFQSLLQVLEKNGIVNKFKNIEYASMGGVQNQVYQEGLYDISLSEAMIVKVKVPQVCRYWNFQTADRLWHTHEFHYAQSSLNGYVDRADSDGWTRLVLAHEDPGVANWIDLTHVEKGYMLMRWTACNETPVPEVKKVAFEDIDKYLPADTKRVTPEQRDEDLRKRAVARQLRRNW